MGSVGVFDSQHYLSVGREILMKGIFSISPEEVKNLITQLNGKHNAQYTFIPQLQNLTQFHIRVLRKYADEKYRVDVIKGEADIEDFKINISPNELKTLIGEKSVNELESLF